MGSGAISKSLNIESAGRAFNGIDTESDIDVVCILCRIGLCAVGHLRDEAYLCLIMLPAKITCVFGKTPLCRALLQVIFVKYGTCIRGKNPSDFGKEMQDGTLNDLGL